MVPVPIRSLIGPCLVGLATWCAAGDLTVASVESPVVRVSVPAGPWWLAVGFGLAMLVRPWRRRPLLATPVVLTILPWLPLPLPVIALLWTGALAWVPLALALVAAWVAGHTKAPHEGVDVLPARQPALHAVAAGGATLLVGFLVLWSIHPRLPGGDEPHYLVITQSLLLDGDLRIENNHTRRDYAAYWGGSLDPHFVQRGRDGEIYSIHAPGTSVLVAPGFAAFGLRGAQLTVLLFGAIASAFMWVSAWTASRSRGAAWFGWAAVAGSVTFLVQSVTVFPDGPGAAILAASVALWARLAAREPVSRGALVVVSALLAALPFLHTRFVVLAAGMGIAILLALWSDEASPRVRVRRMAMFLAVPAVGAIGWLAFFQVIYGTPNPVIPYGSNSETRLEYVPGGVAGLLFDQQFGLIAYAPVLMLALPGWVGARRGNGPSLRAMGTIAAVYVSAVAMYWMWWAGGPASPARLLTSVLPLLAAPVAVAWQRWGVMGRTVAVVLLGASIATSVLVLSVDSGALAWNERNAHAAWLGWMGAVPDLPRAWPSFFWQLIGGDVASELPFGRHLAVWAVAVLVATTALAAVARRASGSGKVTCGAWWLPVVLMGGVQASWWDGHVPRLNPVQSQLQVLGAAARGRGLVRVAPMTVERLGTGTAAMRLGVPRTDLPGSGDVSWAALRHVPAGRYDLRLLARRPTGGTLALQIGRGAPFQVVTFGPLSDQVVPVDLPAGASELRLVPDQVLVSGAQRLELVPRTLAPVQTEARAMLRAGRLDVFFVDDRIYLEQDAFWVRSGRTAATVFFAHGDTPGVASFQLVNGPRPNAITVVVSGVSQQFDLAGGEVRRVSVDVRGATAVSIGAAGGFTPSDDGRSADRRELGVRVEAIVVAP